MFAAVIFDCDGCLVDSEVLAAEVLREALTGVGLAYDPGRYMGMSDAGFFALLDEERRRLLAEPLPADFRALHGSRLDAAIDARLEEIDGAAEAVRRCPRPKAIASGSPMAALERKLDKVGLRDVFAPHIYSADQAGRGKPAPDVFLHAARALDVSPAACLAIEDSLNGVRAAVAAGMTVWGFVGGGHIGPDDARRLADAGAVRILRHWDEAADVFAGW